MPRNVATSVQNRFTKGLITEATGLNFPEDAATDTENCRYDPKGLVTRRFGIDLEEAGTFQTIDRDGVVVNAYLWEAVAGDGTNTFAVVQVGTSLYFYEVVEGALSAGYVESLSLTSHSTGGPSIGSEECCFASGDGVLFVVHPYMEHIYISYDAGGSPKFTATEYNLTIRDFAGVDDGLEVDERPTSSTDPHLYNLYNQGWYIDNVMVDYNPSTGAAVFDSPYDTWVAGRSDEPANSDVWWLLKRYLGGAEVFSDASIKTADTTPAPKGHYLLNPYDQDRDTASGLSGLTNTNSGDSRASTVAFFAGRVWYSGVFASGYSNRLYFTQIIENPLQYGYCFQTNDPTSEDRADLLASDGGVIVIQEAGAIINIVALGSILLVFATNGIWAITGSEGIGFKANDFSVNKISRVTSLSRSSFVEAKDIIYFWSEEGIFRIAQAQLSAQLEDITESSIRAFYDDIPLNCKRKAHAAYNRVTQELQWVFRQVESDDVDTMYTFTDILVLNVQSGAFYPWILDTTACSINAIIAAETYNPGSLGEENVLAVTLIPAAGEFAYDTVNVLVDGGGGTFYSTNRHTTNPGTDYTTSMRQLAIGAPNLQNVSLFVAWFGTDLRAEECEIAPKVDATVSDVGRGTRPYSWEVAGQGRGDVDQVSFATEFRVAYGGTPSDASVIRCIQDLASRGYGVTFNPFILMDVPADNGLPDPYGGAEQGAYPWRGRITIYPAIGEVGSPDKTATAGTQIETFYNRAWGYRNFILHYANLCAEAGGVDAFVIGSEMRGLTWVRDSASTFPFVDFLVSLAAEVKAILPNAKLTYGADWSEFVPYNPGDGTGDVYFHLDPLWSSSDITAIGIDNYWPLSDWRDGSTHTDYLAGYTSLYDLDYLRANISGGEGYDWYYGSDADRDSQSRTNITDGAYGKPWVFRYKDIKNWWLNSHYNRPSGTESANPTAWVAESKPIWFNELGAPAVDKATNQPNVFYDPKSSESFFPYYSDGTRDDIIQRQYLRALLGYYNPNDPDFVSGNNPISAVYADRMVDINRLYVYTWDARPYPVFPNNQTVWSDGDNYETGHWLNGRLRSPSLAGNPQIKSAAFKYFSSVPSGSTYDCTFADERDSRFVDWASVSPSDFTSFLVAGYALHGDAQRKWQPNYLHVFTNDDPQEFDLKTSWDFSTENGRISQAQRVQILPSNRDYNVKRLKVRGAGRVCQFRITSVSEQPFSIIGWTSFETQNSSI